ncbi:MAG: indolepyruvate ferredoxin oxidoreductase family protein [Streptosporangiales bacterium]|nr:indolepyruvate ferredoxin oxidoreductase family protein [Streptosporangiales bacterium]
MLGIRTGRRSRVTATASTLTLDDRYVLEEGVVYLTGLQALVRLPLDQHRIDRRAGLDTATFISGYEGSPLAGYDLELMRRSALLDAHQVVHRPGLNEEIAATAVEGSQLTAVVGGARHDGVVGIWYGKAPGLDRATDAIRHGNLMGTHRAGGVLALVGDDPTSKSSTVPSASERGMADLMLPTIYPADPQDILDLGLHGIALSRASGLWVGVKVATNVADGSATAQVHPERVVPVLPELEVDGAPYRHTPTAKMVGTVPVDQERSAVDIRLALACEYAYRNGLNRIVARGRNDRIGIAAAGKTYLDVCQALRALGLDPADEAALAAHGVRLLKIGLIHPLEPRIVAEFSEGLDEIVVVEEKRPFLEAAVKEVLYGRPGAPAVVGKQDVDGSRLLPASGELDPDPIADALARRLVARDAHGDVSGGVPSVRAWLDRRRTRESIALPVLPRTPYFCSGCPHNRSTKVAGDSLVGAGIGCHAMVLLMDPAQVGDVAGLTQMGGEGAQWLGMAPFLDRDHLVQNIGDGTFLHSGSLAVRAAVAAGVNVTYKLLYNSAVAMTGGQQAVGAMSVPVLTDLLASEGVKRTIVTAEDPARYRGVRLAAGAEVWHRDRLLEAQEELAKVPGVTVLIHDQQCAAEKRRHRKRGRLADPPTRVFINERVCEGCGDCGHKSNCLSVQPVETEFGRKTQIHQPSCNKDYSCLDGDCPSFLTVVPGRRPAGRDRAAGRRTAPPLDAADLPEPSPRVPTDRFAMRITGIGGTGVVTVAQVLGTAALIAGQRVRALDQTGLSQKGGAVVSDAKITTEPIDAANKLAAGECDLYLGCDLLVAADAKNLEAADPDRTVAVVSTTKVPTGHMVADTSIPFPDPDGLLDRIGRASRAGQGAYVDAQRLAEDLFGDDQYANILLVGTAYQAGALPLPADAIEEAIRLNGAAVEANLQAFRRGRQAVCDPDALRAAVDGTRPQPAVRRSPSASETDPRASEIADRVRAGPDSELARLVAIRVPDLVAYQNPRYAESYAGVIERVRAAEGERTPGSTALAEAVARGLYKLMAYKDEYEVARLSLDPELRAEITARFGSDARYAWKLHPPILRALGMKKKITLGPWFGPVFRVLRALRRLRGTPLDAFGYARVRRVERELIREYREVVDELVRRLSPDNHALAVEIAELPDLVRGYEQVKLTNVELYRERLRELRGRLGSPLQPAA